MPKKRFLFLLVAAVLTVAFCLPLLVACNDKGAEIAGKDVERPSDIFTDDIDTVDSENLAASASVTTASETETSPNLIDGDEDTAWTAANATGEYIILSFGKEVTFNTVVLQFFEEKKIDFKIDTGGSLGVLTISINFADEFADGIRLPANVASHAEYTLLSSDATFDGIEADYAAAHGSANA